MMRPPLPRLLPQVLLVRMAPVAKHGMLLRDHSIFINPSLSCRFLVSIISEYEMC